MHTPADFTAAESEKSHSHCFLQPWQPQQATMSLPAKSGGALARSRVQSISDTVEYVLEDEEEQRTLQFILHPSASVYIDTNCLCWNTDGAEIIDKTSIFTHLLAFKNYTISEVRNSSNVPVLVGVGQLSSGKIARVDLFIGTAQCNLYVCKENFLGSTSDVLINKKVLPIAAIDQTLLLNPFLLHSYYLVERKGLPPPATSTRAATSTAASTTVFLQSSSSILKKSLRRGEVLDVLLQCVVAFDETVTVGATDTAFSRSRLRYLTSKVYVRLTGPGTVYFSSHSSRRLLSNRVSVENRFGQGSVAGLVLHVLFVAFFYYSVNSILARLGQMTDLLRQD